MASTVSGTEIAEEVRQRCDLASYTTNTKITSTWILTAINDSAGALSNHLMASLGDDFFTRETLVFTTGSSAPLGDLDPPMYRLRRVHWNRSTTEAVPLRRGKVDDWGRFGTLSQGSGEPSVAPEYALFGDTLKIWPHTNNSLQLQLYYVTCMSFSTLSDTETMWPGWKEWIVLDTMRKVRERLNQHELAAKHAADRDVVMETFVKATQDRDEWGPQTIRDVYAESDSFFEPRRPRSF